MTDADPFTDQAATAYAEVAAINKALGSTRDDSIPPINLQPLIDAWMKAETFPGCEHARQPIPLVGILTRPGLLFCLACAPQAKRDHVLSSPDTCDACGLEPDDLQFHEVSIPLGMVGWLHGWVCPRCIIKACAYVGHWPEGECCPYHRLPHTDKPIGTAPTLVEQWEIDADGAGQP